MCDKSRGSETSDQRDQRDGSNRKRRRSRLGRRCGFCTVGDKGDVCGPEVMVNHKHDKNRQTSRQRRRSGTSETLKQDKTNGDLGVNVIWTVSCSCVTDNLLK